MEIKPYCSGGDITLNCTYIQMPCKSHAINVGSSTCHAHIRTSLSLQLAIGQYGGLGPNKLFGRMVPALKGLGYGMLVIMFLVSIYYNMIIAWTIYYTFAGFTSQLPWQYCGNEYNSRTCFQKEMAENCTEGSSGFISYYNNTCTKVADICDDFGLQHAPDKLDSLNFTMCKNVTHDIPLEKV